MPEFEQLRAEYAAQWARMSVLPNKAADVDAIARKLIGYRPHYESVATKTGVPWQLVAVLHERESGADFATHLHNGDPLSARTVHVPAGRPVDGHPPFTWEQSAIDALTMRGLEQVHDWPIERMAYEAEGYNGWGYRNHNVPSAYLWSFSSIYQGGKYVADGVWNSSAIDRQCGVMPLIKRIEELTDAMPITTPKQVKHIDLAAQIIAAMERLGNIIDRESDEINIVYVEGMEPDGTPNGNRPNAFDDIRCVISFEKGKPVLRGVWEATTETGVYYTQHPVPDARELGAAIIALGQQDAWQVGDHRGYEALVQTGGPVAICRDLNKDYKREGDKVTVGYYGINQHHAFDAPKDDIGPHSAGCLVGRTVAGHHEFMALCKSDPRYIDDSKFVFATTVLSADEVLAAEPAKPPVSSEQTAGAAAAVAAGGIAAWLGAHPLIIIGAVIAVAVAAFLILRRKS